MNNGDPIRDFILFLTVLLIVILSGAAFAGWVVGWTL